MEIKIERTKDKKQSETTQDYLNEIFVNLKMQESMLAQLTDKLKPIIGDRPVVPELPRDKSDNELNNSLTNINTTITESLVYISDICQKLKIN